MKKNILHISFVLFATFCFAGNSNKEINNLQKKENAKASEWILLEKLEHKKLESITDPKERKRFIKRSEKWHNSLCKKAHKIAKKGVSNNHEIALVEAERLIIVQRILELSD